MSKEIVELELVAHGPGPTIASVMTNLEDCPTNVRARGASELRTMPEAYALRSIIWQIFATFTFVDDSVLLQKRKSVLFAWLREVARHSKTHFKQVLWVTRYELGRRTLRGHFHVCIGGLKCKPSALDCRRFEFLWRYRTGAIAVVTPYDPARDGVGYALKRAWTANQLGSNPGDEEECGPTLSDSIIRCVMRRGRI